MNAIASALREIEQVIASRGLQRFEAFVEALDGFVGVHGLGSVLIINKGEWPVVVLEYRLSTYRSVLGRLVPGPDGNPAADFSCSGVDGVNTKDDAQVVLLAFLEHVREEAEGLSPEHHV